MTQWGPNIEGAREALHRIALLDPADPLNVPLLSEAVRHVVKELEAIRRAHDEAITVLQDKGVY